MSKMLRLLGYLWAAPVSLVGHALAEGDCVIFYGTVPSLQHIQLHYRWLPGGWGTMQNLDCASGAQ